MIRITSSKLKVTLNSRGGLAIRFFPDERQLGGRFRSGAVLFASTFRRGSKPGYSSAWLDAKPSETIHLIFAAEKIRAEHPPAVTGPVHARRDATLLRQTKRLNMPQARNFVEVLAEPSGQPSTLEEPATAEEPAVSSALLLLVKTALSGLQTTTDLYSAIESHGQRDEGFNNCSG
jgi:hypothetical protein